LLFWTLTCWLPQRTAAGVHTHVTFVMLIVATATAYRHRRYAGVEVNSPNPTGRPALSPGSSGRSS